MAEENKHEYEGQGLRGPLWTVAGATLANLIGNVHGGILGTSGSQSSSEACELRSRIAALESEKYTDGKDAELRTTIIGNWIKPLADEAAANKVEIATIKADVAKNKEIVDLQMQLAEQKAATAQATTNGAIFSLNQQVCELMSLTKRKVLADNVCPLPMPRYNTFDETKLTVSEEGK